MFAILEGELENLGEDYEDIYATLGDYGYVREGEFLELFIGRMARSNISVGIFINLGSGVTEIGMFQRRLKDLQFYVNQPISYGVRINSRMGTIEEYDCS